MAAVLWAQLTCLPAEVSLLVSARLAAAAGERHTAGGKRDPGWAAAAERDRLAERYQPTAALLAH